MNDQSPKGNSTDQSSQDSSDNTFKLLMAEDVWMKVKGYPIPDCYSEKDRLEIFDRYYHRAVAQSQGE